MNLDDVASFLGGLSSDGRLYRHECSGHMGQFHLEAFTLHGALHLSGRKGRVPKSSTACWATTGGTALGPGAPAPCNFQGRLHAVRRPACPTETGKKVKSIATGQC
jgi:hypothetical protein